MDLEEYLKGELKEIKEAAKETRKDVKSLMLFVAVEKHKNKRGTMLISGCISLAVSVLSGAVLLFMKG